VLLSSKHLADVVLLWIIRCLCLYHLLSCITRVCRHRRGPSRSWFHVQEHCELQRRSLQPCSTQELYAGISAVVITTVQMHVVMRVCTDRPCDILKRQFNVVDGQEWQRQKAKHDDCVLSSFA